jgi:uncharacterized protein (DUF362 family)
VAILGAKSYDEPLKEIVSRGIKSFRLDLKGKVVLLKPNMVEFDPSGVIKTNPLVVEAAIDAFRSLGARQVVVAEGPGHRRDTEYLVTRTGLYDHLREHGVHFVDLNEDDVEYVPLASRYMGLDQLALPVTLLQSDFIVSMPKLKAHHWAGITCGFSST